MPRKTKLKQMPPVPEWLRIGTMSRGAGIGVDREKNVINGYVVAQEGPFKDGRGHFDLKSLRMIKKLMEAEPKGLKSRFSHPNESDDGLGKFLGRVKNPRMDKILKPDPEDETKYQELNIVRADLYLDPTCFNTPSGNLGEYVMSLAESDPDAFSSSLVLKTDQEAQMDDRGRQLVDESGLPLPTLWRPLELHASDVVDTGDAVDGFLSVDHLPDAIVRRGTELLDQQFSGQTREVVEKRCQAYLDRYLDHRFGAKPALANTAKPKDATQALAGYGGLTIGDLVEWWEEDEDCMCAERQRGIVKAVATTGPLDIPGTSLELEGSVEDPAALIAAYDDDDDVSAAPDGDCMYLVPFSKLEKVIVPREEPVAGTTPIGYMAPETTDDDLLLEIEMRRRAM